MPSLTVVNSLVDTWLDELDSAEEAFQKSKPPKPIIKFRHDPVACACASYRVWKENPARRWEDLESVVVWQDDIDEAGRLKKYYRERMVLSALKNVNGNTSTFRQKLGALVTDQLEITKDEFGLLHRLPYFYAEDQALDYVVENTIGAKIQALPQDTHPMVMTFRPLKRILRSRRSSEHHQYWWTTADKGVPFMVAVRSDNPLLGMIDDLFERDSIDLSCKVKPSEFHGYHRGRWYYHMFDLRLPR